MIIPVRCFSCGKVLGNKWEKYQEKIKNGIEPKIALTELGLIRICCRTVVLTHVDLIEKMLNYSSLADDGKECKRGRRID